MKKGFTLVEILVIFVLIGIIGLITVPAMINIMDEYGKDSFIESAKGVILAAETYYAENDYDNFSEEGLNINDENLKLKNKNQFTSGTIIYNNSTKKFELLSLTDGNFCANGTKEDLVVITGNCDK